MFFDGCSKVVFLIDYALGVLMFLVLVPAMSVWARYITETAPMVLGI